MLLIMDPLLCLGSGQLTRQDETIEAREMPNIRYHILNVTAGGGLPSAQCDSETNSSARTHSLGWFLANWLPFPFSSEVHTTIARTVLG